MDNTLIPQILQTYDYYKNKLPLYLQEDKKFMSHFKNWYDLLNGNSKYSGIVNSAQTLFELLNIFDANYLVNMSQLENYNEYQNDVLDKLGDLFGVTRNFKQTYWSYSQQQEVTTTFNLNNEDFLILIKTQIIKNYCDGTLQQIQSYYRDTAKLNMYVYTHDSLEATCNVLFVKTGGAQIDETLYDMLEAGLLNIESVGIRYVYSQVNPEAEMYWAENEYDSFNINTWDIGEWAL